MRHRARGFTLIELMVVILIIGILLGVTLLSPLSATTQRRMQDEVIRLERLIENARDRALLDGAELGFSADDESYRWWWFDEDSDSWQSLEQGSFRPWDIHNSLRLVLQPEDEALQFSYDSDQGPQVLISSDTELTPFRMYVVARDNPKHKMVLESDGLSPVSWGRE
ncbi:type II secretion system minor pseudopilin GspH [Endozoicomonadaceae bacterium StTr2]